MSKPQPAGKDQRQQAILALVSRGSAHTQQDIAAALSRRGHRVTQATISRDIHELGLVRSGAGYRSTAALVRLRQPGASRSLKELLQSGD